MMLGISVTFPEVTAKATPVKGFGISVTKRDICPCHSQSHASKGLRLFVSSFLLLFKKERNRDRGKGVRNKKVYFGILMSQMAQISGTPDGKGLRCDTSLCRTDVTDVKNVTVFRISHCNPHKSGGSNGIH